ncbi:hybrid sensor histidine kinase/response regulator [Candidatus Halobeggiatoa sp. HSG11]|nr:hybrid sensor histidine kinase/response regulator [Candidatus Halobeggiatoa sp. HSG11]
MTKKPLILIVDDTLKNIQVLGSILLEHEYDIHVAQDGQQALDAINTISPDLILLDVIMPIVDGFETCRRLKANTKTKHIPVIFLTAKTADEDMLKGFELGGIDYVTKPFSSVVLLARVNTHLNLKFAYEKLKSQKEALEKAETLRRNVERIIQHDLKSPLNGIITFSELLAEDADLKPEFRKKAFTQISNSGHQMWNMLDRFFDIYKMETGQYHCSPVLINIIDVIEKAIFNSKYFIEFKQLTIDIIYCGKPIAKDIKFTVLGEKILCYSTLDNLLKNAVEASPKMEHITITLSEKDTKIISIHNKGAVPEEIRDKFFDKYTTINKSNGTGLGTYSAKLMVEAQGGTIQLETSDEIGTTVIIHLPI